MSFATTWIKILNHCTSVKFSLLEGYVQGALQKEMYVAPFVERFRTATLGRSHRCISPVLVAVYLNIAFQQNFC